MFPELLKTSIKDKIPYLFFSFLFNFATSFLSNSRPVHGLIFLYKWRPGEEPQGSLVIDDRIRDIFFAKQVLGILMYV